MRKIIISHKNGIDFFLSLLVICTAIWLLVSDCCNWNQNLPNYCLIFLAILCLIFKLFINKSNPVSIIHTLIHVLSFIVIILLILMNKAFSISVGNIATFSTAALAFISSEYLVASKKSSNERESDKEISNGPILNELSKTSKDKALEYLAESMKSVPAPNATLPYRDPNAIDKMRDAYIKIITDECFLYYKRDNLKKSVGQYYDKLNNIYGLTDNEYKNLYSKLYHSINSFIDNENP